MFGIPAHRLGQGARFLVLADSHQFPGRLSVVDSDHILFDDGPLVELCGDEVCGRANEFHAPLVSLTIGICSLESRQKRMVDVDYSAPECCTDLGGEDLHVASEYDQFDVVFGHGRE